MGILLTINIFLIFIFLCGCIYVITIFYKSNREISASDLEEIYNSKKTRENIILKMR